MILWDGTMTTICKLAFLLSPLLVHDFQKVNIDSILFKKPCN